MGKTNLAGKTDTKAVGHLYNFCLDIILVK